MMNPARAHVATHVVTGVTADVAAGVAAQVAVERQATADPALPGLALALDPELVGGLLARRGALAAGARLLIRHVRYHPRRGAWIAYETVAKDGESVRLLYGRLDAPGIEPLAGHERAALEPELASAEPEPAEPAIVVVPEIPMVVRFFPHDPVLRRLAEICRLTVIKRQVETMLAGEGTPWKIKRSTALGRVVRYKPERRCVIRLHLDARGRESGRKRRLGLYGQADADGAGESAARFLGELAGGAGAMGPIAVPRPKLYDSRLQLFLQEEIEGTPLIAQLERDDMKKVVRRLAGRIVDIQRSGVRPPRTLDLADRLHTLSEVEATLGAVAAAVECDLHARAAAVRSTLVTHAEPAPVTACLHGDFHAGQVLVRGRRSWIVDFDRAAAGDPLIDPATFVAGLRIEAEEGRLPRRTARRAAKVFLRAYSTAWPAAWDPARLQWQVAVALFEAAVAPLRQLRSGWIEQVARRLELAAAIAAGEEVAP